ncbi:MAG: hypothetical protein II560_04745 [Bacteroidales bacterium]|nr:hypothetical protein [Bacteroidales bacterium]
MEKRHSNIMKLLFAAFVASSFILTGCKSEKLNYDAIEVHSHNDYVQANPFWGAFNAGTPSIEADVYLVDGDLYVAHRKKELIIDPEHTLRSMYLEPLKKEWDKNGGKPYVDGGPLWLMVDMKRDQHASLSKLVEIIEAEGYLPMFDVTSNPSAVKLVVTNLPDIIENHQEDFPEWVYYDGIPNMTLTEKGATKVAMISEKASVYTSWSGEGEMAPEEQQAIKAAIEDAHKIGTTFRLWDFPDGPEAWEMSVKLGLDWINTDKPAEAVAWLKAKRENK